MPNTLNESSAWTRPSSSYRYVLLVVGSAVDFLFVMSFQILFEFHSREGRFPSLKSKESDLKLLEQLRDSVTSKFELPEKKIPASINPLLFSELSPVAAIVGGVLAQEVIKTISNKDRPHKNFFLFNPLQSAGVVEIVE